MCKNTGQLIPEDQADFHRELEPGVRSTEEFRNRLGWIGDLDFPGDSYLFSRFAWSFYIGRRTLF